MAKFVIEAGATADVLSPAELRDALLDQEVRAQAAAAGYKWTEAVVPGATPAVNNVQLGGPGSGWAWKMRLISVSLSAAGIFGAFKGEAPGPTGTVSPTSVSRPLGTPVSTAVLGGFNLATLFFPDDIIIPSGQNLFVLASQTILSLYYGAIQVPAQRVGEHVR